jgi:hypothetical protein
MPAEVRRESRRGCGYRRPGLYLVGPGPNAECCALPVPLKVCPTCHAGIHPTRAWTWIDPRPIFDPIDRACEKADDDRVFTCPLADNLPDRAGLLWVGTAFYATVDDFLREARRMGVSRRISALPKGFKAGETRVFFAHRKVILGKEAGPAIFQSFIPSAVEIVVEPTTSEAQLDKHRRRGLVPVIVERADATVPMNMKDAEKA